MISTSITIRSPVSTNDTGSTVISLKVVPEVIAKTGPKRSQVYLHMQIGDFPQSGKICAASVVWCGGLNQRLVFICCCFRLWDRILVKLNAMVSFVPEAGVGFFANLKDGLNPSRLCHRRKKTRT
jgi:predicted DNA-binding transcriptional regulator AlpA